MGLKRDKKRMKTLLEGFRGYLKEIKNRYEFVVFVRMENDLNLYADIFEKIRAIPGVTIVKTAEKQQDISPTQKAAVLDIKCIAGDTGILNYGMFLRNKLSKLKDESGDKVLGVRFLSPPEDLS
jgi:hypothetical protein